MILLISAVSEPLTSPLADHLCLGRATRDVNILVAQQANGTDGGYRIFADRIPVTVSIRMMTSTARLGSGEGVIFTSNISRFDARATPRIPS
jgi:hypothetical protein